MSFLNLEAFKTTPLLDDPFDHVVVPGFLRQESMPLLHREFPGITKPGSYPLSELNCRPDFRALVTELHGTALQTAVEEKFAINLAGHPVMVTIRGRCQRKDGRIHTDSKSKIVTLLIYMNLGWTSDAGRLRLLRGSKNLDDSVVEVSPTWGTLVCFRRSDHSYHGHKSFVGERRVIQVNWMIDQEETDRELGRHRLSARLKRAMSFT